MIELKIEGVCKECIFKELVFIEWDRNVRCRHGEVCKFIGDPHGEERYRIAVNLMKKKTAEEFKIVTWDDMERENNA